MQDPEDFFRNPKNLNQRRYEALRAYLLEKQSAIEVGFRFHFSTGYIRVLATLFRQGRLPQIFADPPIGRRKAPQDMDLAEQILELRKQKQSVYDIARKLTSEGHPVSHNKVWTVLKDAGMERLPKRRAAEKKAIPKLHPPVADIHEMNLTPGRIMPCQAPMLFLFAPLLAQMGFPDIVEDAHYPGSSMIRGPNFLLSLLSLKLLSRDRKNQVMHIAEEEAFGLFAGLNVLPKTTALSDYSYRTGPRPNRFLLEKFIEGRERMRAYPSLSFNLDFHAIRHYGEPDKSFLEKDYVPRRSQSVPAVITAFAQEEQGREMVYSNANILKDEKADEVLRFVDFWKETTKKIPQELVFDCRMTTHKGLAKLDDRNICFLTLRERRAKEIRRVQALPPESWTRVELDIEDRKWKTPRVLDERIELPGYPGTIRQIAALDLGREEPTFLLTNDTRRGAAALLNRYVRRTHIENSISEQVHFFHVDALSSSVRIKVDLDVVLSVVASGCYRWLARQLRGFENATAQTIWNNILNRPGSVLITKDEVVLKVRRFRFAPVLLESKVSSDSTKIPWLGDRAIRLEII